MIHNNQSQWSTSQRRQLKKRKDVHDDVCCRLTYIVGVDTHQPDLSPLMETSASSKVVLAVKKPIADNHLACMFCLFSLSEEDISCKQTSSCAHHFYQTPSSLTAFQWMSLKLLEIHKDSNMVPQIRTVDICQWTYCLIAWCFSYCAIICQS